jgi:hypothetical protein
MARADDGVNRDLQQATHFRTRPSGNGRTPQAPASRQRHGTIALYSGAPSSQFADMLKHVLSRCKYALW